VTDYTVDQLKEAARRAYEAGDAERAKRFIDEARRVMSAGETREVVATTPDGGKVYRGKDGALSFANAAYSTNDPAKVAEIMKGATPAQVSTSSFDQQTIAQHPIAARGAKFVQGYPFVGQAVDEGIGALAGRDAMQGVRALQGAMDRERPAESLGLQIGGGILGTAGIAAAAGPSVLAAAPQTLGAQVGLGAALGSVGGAVEGAVSGFGRGNDGNRLATAAMDAAFGGAAGAVTGALAPAIGAGGRRVLDWVRGSDVGAVKRAFNVSTPSARIISQDIAALDPASAAANLSTAGPDAMIADAGGPVRELLDTAIAGGGKASQVGTEAIYSRAAQAGSRLDNVLNGIFGKAQGIYTSARKIAERTAPARKAAYDAAFATPIGYGTGGKGEAVLDVLGRVPARIRDKAIQIANDAMQMRGVTNKQILLTFGKDGKVQRAGTLPNVEQLHEVKKALQSVIGGEVDNLGRPTYEASLARALGGQLRDALESAVPGYKTALRIGGDKIAEDEALTLGRGIATAPLEDVRAFADGKPSVNALASARQGMREWLDETISRVRRNPDNPDVDVTETKRLLALLSSGDIRKKAALILGQQRANVLFREIDAAGKHFGTLNAIATGSQTARRTARLDRISDEFSSAVTPSANPFDWAKAGMKWLTGTTDAARNDAEQSGLSEIARALTTMRGQDAQDALRLVTAALQGQPIKSEQARKFGRVLSSAVALVGNQTGTQQSRMPTRAQ
jgi:hypothetical protein